jgi:hypothetical protein
LQKHEILSISKISNIKTKPKLENFVENLDITPTAQ